MGLQKTTINASLLLPTPMLERIERMAVEREMGRDALLVELIQLGELSLRRARPVAEAGLRYNDREHSVVLPSTGNKRK